MTDNQGILIVSSSVRFSETLSPIVKKLTGRETLCAVSIAEAQKTLMTNPVYAIILNAPLSDGFGIDFSVKCAKEKNYAVLMFIPKEFTEQAAAKTSEHGILILPKPNTQDVVGQSVSLLDATAKKISSLKNTENVSTDKIEELRLITRAKLILISSFGMTEMSAHKFIEKRAMESRKTKADIARGIITSYGS